MMRRALTIGLVGVVAALAGCESPQGVSTDASGAASADASASAADEEISSPPTSTAPTARAAPASPVGTARAILTAYAESDGATACSMQTARYTDYAIGESITYSQLRSGATCRDMVALASGLYESYGIDPAAAEYDLVDESSNEARVLVDYGGELGAVTLVLVRSDRTWLLDQEIEGG